MARTSSNPGPAAPREDGKKLSKNKLQAAAVLQKEGNDFFVRGDYQEALKKYAAALASGGENDVELAAKLRSNRSFCCLKLGSLELALSEAELCQKLRPDWPKAHFRAAKVLEAMNRLGDARLAVLEAFRIEPADKEVTGLLQSLREKIFSGPAERVGVALDALENYQAPPGETHAAALELRDLLVGESAHNEVQAETPERTARIKAFLAGGGSSTVFRRQNAMGTYWKEECKNGTMSLLSEVAAAAPQLEEELVKLNQEAEEKEIGCEGDPACAPPSKGTNRKPNPVPAPPFAASTSRPGQRRRQGTGAKPLAAACDFGDAGDDEPIDDGAASLRSPDEAEAHLQEKSKEILVESSSAADENSSDPQNGEAIKENCMMTADADLVLHSAVADITPCCTASPVLTEVGLPERVVLRVLEAGTLKTLATATAVCRMWKNASKIPCTGNKTSWTTLLEQRWPGLTSQLTTTTHHLELLRCMLGPRLQPQTLDSGSSLRLEQWSFILDVQRDGKVLWHATITKEHALPGVLTALPNLPNAHVPKGMTKHVIGPTLHERLDVVMPGDKRRAAVAGAVAALAAAAEDGIVAPGFTSQFIAVHANSGKLMSLSTTLVPGSRCSCNSEPPAAVATPVYLPAEGGKVLPSDLLRVVVGVGAEHVLPGPRAPYPPGSLQVRTGLAFVGPDGRWLSGAVVIASLLGQLSTEF